MKKVVVALLTLAVIISVMPVVFAESNYIIVSAYDYTAVENHLEGASQNGIVLDRYKVSMTTGESINTVLQRAFDENNIPVEGIEQSYVSSINGLAAAQGYSGWNMAYNNDDYSNWGMSSIALSPGDEIRFDYSCNFDTITDDIGNGWQGKPIVTEFSLDGKKTYYGRSSYYDLQYNLISSYYQEYINNATKPLAGDGSKENPFIINVPVGMNFDLTSVTPEYKTTLNEHYRVVEGLGVNQNATNGIEFSVSTLGGMYKAYYKAIPYRVNSLGACVKDITDAKIGAEYSHFGPNQAYAFLTVYDKNKTLIDVKAAQINGGAALLEAEKPASDGFTYKLFMWNEDMSPLY